MYAVKLKKSTEKELDRIPAKTRDRIIAQILSLKENPRPFGYKKLAGYDWYRIRSGDYRMLYVVDDGKKTIEVLSVGNRKDIYR
jgi:mRNA interferase RelE/StbE